ncbi:hypothetical protein WA158_001847 [Blastocystis sp. Blastoise]
MSDDVVYTEIISLSIPCPQSRTLFSQYGLLYFFLPFTKGETSEISYAIIWYYSSYAAKMAIRDLNNSTIHNHKMHVSISETDHEYRNIISENQMYALMGYYAGYDSWSNKVVYSHKIPSLKNQKKRLNINTVHPSISSTRYISPELKQDECFTIDHEELLSEDYQSIYNKYIEINGIDCRDDDLYICHVQFYIHPSSFIYKEKYGSKEYEIVNTELVEAIQLCPAVPVSTYNRITKYILIYIYILYYSLIVNNCHYLIRPDSDIYMNIYKQEHYDMEEEEWTDIKES